jgi:hypothetical protein
MRRFWRYGRCIFDRYVAAEYHDSRVLETVGLTGFTVMELKLNGIGLRD